jgi:hypothetical protein
MVPRSLCVGLVQRVVPRLTNAVGIGNVIALARSGEDFERQGRSVAMDLLRTLVRSDASGARPRSTLPTSGHS